MSSLFERGERGVHQFVKGMLVGGMLSTQDKSPQYANSRTLWIIHASSSMMLHIEIDRISIP